MFINYSDEELEALKSKDKTLAEYITSIGKIKREAEPELFEALASSIVSQQISNKACASIMERLHRLCPYPMEPCSFLKCGREAVKECGISYKKTDWILNIAKEMISKRLDRNLLDRMSDDDVVKTLSSLPGIGVWTAQMLLIFCLGRKDILSYGDLGIRKGIMKTFGLSELSKEEFMAIRNRLSPHNTLASLYFWEIASQK